MGVAFHNHHDVLLRFPTGGTVPWAWSAAGTRPDKIDYWTRDGFPYQGPSWLYQILPYIEQSNIKELTSTADVERAVIPTYFCPSRRKPTRNWNYGLGLNDYAGVTPYDGTTTLTPSTSISDQYWFNSLPKPPGITDWTWSNPLDADYRGIIIRSNDAGHAITTSQVLDGTSNTSMIGEKFVVPKLYDKGDWCDDRGWTDGWDPDVMRFTAFAPVRDKNDSIGLIWDHGYYFGAAHPAGINMAYGDGSVHFVSYNVDRNVFNRLGDRRDGNVIDPP